MADRKILLLGTLAALLLLLTGWMWLSRAQPGDRFAQCSKSTVAGGLGSLGTPFTLTDENGNRVTDQQVFTRPTLLYFGYTFCPDVCPLDSARNADALDILKSHNYNAQIAFITVDPKRDTPAVLRQFTDSFSPDMLGLTGTPDEIAAVNKGWRNYYKAHDDEDPNYYLVDHMTNTYLVLPGHGTVEFFGRDIPAQEMADRTACFIDAEK